MRKIQVYRDAFLRFYSTHQDTRLLLYSDARRPNARTISWDGPKSSASKSTTPAFRDVKLPPFLLA